MCNETNYSNEHVFNENYYYMPYPSDGNYDGDGNDSESISLLYSSSSSMSSPSYIINDNDYSWEENVQILSTSILDTSYQIKEEAQTYFNMTNPSTISSSVVNDHLHKMERIIVSFLARSSTQLEKLRSIRTVLENDDNGLNNNSSNIVTTLELKIHREIVSLMSNLLQCLEISSEEESHSSSSSLSEEEKKTIIDNETIHYCDKTIQYEEIILSASKAFHPCKIINDLEQMIESINSSLDHINNIITSNHKVFFTALISDQEKTQHHEKENNSQHSLVEHNISNATATATFIIQNLCNAILQRNENCQYDTMTYFGIILFIMNCCGIIQAYFPMYVVCYISVIP